MGDVKAVLTDAHGQTLELFGDADDVAYVVRTSGFDDLIVPDDEDTDTGYDSTVFGQAKHYAPDEVPESPILDLTQFEVFDATTGVTLGRVDVVTDPLPQHPVAFVTTVDGITSAVY